MPVLFTIQECCRKKQANLVVKPIDTFTKFIFSVFLTAVFLFFSSFPGFCDEPLNSPPSSMRKLTIADAVFLALTNNVTLRSAYLDRHLQRIDLQIAERRNYLPTDPSLNLGVNRVSLYTPPGGATDSTRTENLNFTGVFAATLAIPTGGTLTFAWNNLADRPDIGQQFNYSSDWYASFKQPLLKGGGLTNAAYTVRIARITEEINILTLKDTISTTIQTAISAFRNYKTAERQLVIAEMGLVRAKALYQYNKDMIEAGRLAGTEIVQAQADIASQETSLIEARNNLENARLTLIQALYIEKNTMFEAVDENQEMVFPPSLEDALSLAFKYRTDYRRALHNLEANKLSLQKAKRNRLWNLNLEISTYDSAAAATFNSYGSALNRSVNSAAERDWYAGLSLEIPLVYMTSDMRSYYGAKNDLEKTTLAMEKMKLDITIDVQNAVRNVDSRYRSLKSATQARELAEKKLLIEQEKLSAGRTTNFQLVSFQRDLQTAQLNELSTMTAYLNSLTSLDDKLGTTLITWKIHVGKEDDQIKSTSVNQTKNTLKP